MDTVAIAILIALFTLVVALFIVLLVVLRARRDDTGRNRAPAMVELAVLTGLLHGSRYKLRKSELTIGNNPSCDVVLNEPGVSPFHALVSAESGRYVLTDRNSQNGVWAKGRRVFAAVLQPGAQFQIGVSVFTLIPAGDPLPQSINHLERRSPPGGNPPEAAANVRGFNRLEKIGTGGQVTVYRAQSKTDNSYVAVKYLNNPPQEDDRGYFLQKFKQQILIGVSIRHPHCVRILGGDPTSNPPYLVEEFVYGKTLRDHMVGSRLQFDECVRIIGEICDALYYLHRKNLIHRDIKPSNILLDANANGSVRLTDFGLVRIAGAPRQTQIGMCLGTPHYMSVEQARGDSTRITPHSDLYSLGVVAYEMFTGKLPFDGSNDTILNQHLKVKPRPPRDLDQRVPEWISRAILCALEKDPTKRFRDASEMARAFRYDKSFNEGEVGRDVRLEGASLRLQNAATGMMIPINRSPTVLTRQMVNAADKMMSREHGRVFVQDGYWRIAEQAGRPTENGIYVNGVRIDEEGDIIQPGDEIRLGHTALRVIG